MRRLALRSGWSRTARVICSVRRPAKSSSGVAVALAVTQPASSAAWRIADSSTVLPEPRGLAISIVKSGCVGPASMAALSRSSTASLPDRVGGATPKVGRNGLMLTAPILTRPAAASTRCYHFAKFC